jgi:hypothetical protein
VSGTKSIGIHATIGTQSEYGIGVQKTLAVINTLTGLDKLAPFGAGTTSSSCTVGGEDYADLLS